MRNFLFLAVSASTLAACGGSTAPQSVGSVASAGSGATTADGSVPDNYAQFTNPTVAKTYVGIGGEQVYNYMTDSRGCCGQQAQVYAGNATTVRDSGISVTYDPRSAIFTLQVSDPKSGASVNTAFQDPVNRTDFNNSQTPQWGTPNFSQLPAGATSNANIQFLQAGTGNPISPAYYDGSGYIDPGDSTTPPDGTAGSHYHSTTFFYEKPGSTTKYVTLAGYLSNTLDFGTATVGTDSTPITTDKWTLERGAFAYGVLTDQGAVPTSGSGTYTGEMLATMVYNPTLDNPTPTDSSAALPSFFQWITGTSKLTVDFGAKTVNVALAGTVLDPQVDRFAGSSASVLPGGTQFSATGSAKIDLGGTGGFVGSFQGGSATFTAAQGTKFSNGATTASVNVAGSSINGAFYGPKADEVGGGFRIVGGTPDQRVDILGAFTGKK